MNINEKKKKIKSQKNAAQFMIFGSVLYFLFFFKSHNYQLSNLKDYLFAASLLVLVICGFIGLKNSVKKEKEINES